MRIEKFNPFLGKVSFVIAIVRFSPYDSGSIPEKSGERTNFEK